MRGLLLLLLAGCASVNVTRDADRVARAAVERERIPALSVAILRGDRLVLAKGYGSGEPRTVYQSGSISKQFTAAAILKLAERGALSLDDPVTSLLPALPADWGHIRVRHLLGHTSGIREFLFLPEFGPLDEDKSAGPEELRALIARQALVFPAGSRWSYSNSNYTLLAWIIETKSGRPYEEFLAREYFRPLGLKSIHQCQNEPGGYVLRDGVVQPSAIENLALARGDGGLCMDVIDLARWMRALTHGRVVTPDSYKAMTTPRALDGGRTAAYGFGLAMVPLDGRTRIAHNGAMGGFTGTVAYYPGADVTIALLANRGGLLADGIEKSIARAVLGMPPPAVTPVALTAEERSRLLGRFDIGVFDVTVTDRDGTVWMETPRPGPTAELVYLGGGRFVGREQPDAVEVRIDGDEAIVLMGGMHWYGRRVRR